jgi:hypothetical protein
MHQLLEAIGYCALWWVYQDTLDGRGVVVDFVKLFLQERTDDGRHV